MENIVARGLTKDDVSRAVRFYGPVLTVIFFACTLAFVAYMSQVAIQATFFREEGTSSERATAGVLNALTFILPAVIGGFGLVYLFKYRKKLTLKYIFGGTFFFAASFIAYFFASFILRLAILKLATLNMVTPAGQALIGDYPFEPLFYYFDLGFRGVYLYQAAAVIGCGMGGFVLAYTIVSRRFDTEEKNTALLVLGGLMGAFLAIILPTWTVLAMLIGLSLYDIYAVSRGPIRDIVNVAIEEEERMERERDRRDMERLAEMERRMREAAARSPDLEDGPGAPPRAIPLVDRGSSRPEDAPPRAKPKGPERLMCAALFAEAGGDSAATHHAGGGGKPVRAKRKPLLSKFGGGGGGDRKSWKEREEEADLIINSMTYTGGEWELGIGDLVFYSMLTAHAFTFATIYVADHGLWAPLVVALCTSVGILIGFTATIRLLEKYHMLPGLPIPVFLGITGFLLSSGVYAYLL